MHEFFNYLKVFTFLVLFPSLAQACGNSSLSLTSTVDNGNGTFTINMELCVAGGRTGVTTNSQGNTSSFAFAIYSAIPFVVSTYSPSIILNYTGTESAYSYMTGPILGNPPFSEQDNLVYDFTFASFPYYQCNYSSALCGSVHIDCESFSFMTTQIPDSIRALVIEAENNPQNSCGGSELLIDFSPTALNVIWSNISAEQLSMRESLIIWETNSELNNDYFEVQKLQTSDGSWLTINRIDGNGTTNLKHFYSTIDSDFNNDLTYYRIQQTDFNGKKSNSKIVVIAGTDENDFLVYPNPSSNIVTISNAKNIKIRLFQLNGELIRAEDSSQKLLQFDVSTLNEGIYLLEIEKNNLQFHKRLVIEH